MNDRVIALLEGEVKKMLENNEMMSRQISFYLERVTSYRKAISDNELVIHQCKNELDEMSGRAEFQRQVEIKKIEQRHILDVAMMNEKADRENARQAHEILRDRITKLEDGGAMGTHTAAEEYVEKNNLDIPF